MNIGQTGICGQANVWGFAQSRRDNSLFTGKPVVRGEGRAYQLVLAALDWTGSPTELNALPEKSEHKSLDEALAALRGVVSHRKTGDYSSLVSSLHADYDIDDVIQFSHAWQCWDSLPHVLRGSKSVESLRLGQSHPLDQQLFRGTHPESPAYLDGIERVANRHAEKVERYLRKSLPSYTFRSLLDLGAGPGVYARQLVDCGIAGSATCVDFEPAVRRARFAASAKTEWIAEDLFNLNLPEDARYDLVYIGNVFHHYSLAENSRYLRRIANNLSPGAVIIVQDYVLANDPKLSPLYAAILGVHFALTSTDGRCYSKEEFSRVMGNALPAVMLQSECNLGSSDLLIYRCA